MEPDVASTLTELERKLKELERELESVGRGGEPDTDPAQAGWRPPPEDAPAPPPDPGPPPPGATPFTAVWHGQAEAPPHPWPQAAPPPPPAPPPPGPGPHVIEWRAYGTPPPAGPQQDVRFTAVPPSPPASPPASQPDVAFAAVPPPPAGPQHDPPDPLNRQFDELVRFREQLVHAANSLVAELSRVLAELETGAAPTAPQAPPAPPAEPLLSGRVVIEASHFDDLATLSAFEQGLARTRGVVDVYVRALDSGRATIDVQLDRPTALAGELRRAAPFAIRLVESGEGRIVLEVQPGGG